MKKRIKVPLIDPLFSKKEIPVLEISPEKIVTLVIENEKIESVEVCMTDDSGSVYSYTQDVKEPLNNSEVPAPQGWGAKSSRDKRLIL